MCVHIECPWYLQHCHRLREGKIILGCRRVWGWGESALAGMRKWPPESADLCTFPIVLNTSNRRCSSNSDPWLKNLSSSQKQTLYLRSVSSYTYPKYHHRPLLFEFIFIAIENKMQTASFSERMLSQQLAISFFLSPLLSHENQYIVCVLL